MHKIVRRRTWIHNTLSFARRCVHGDVTNDDGGLSIPTRQRRDDFWMPQATFTDNAEGPVDVGDLLVRAGFLRQPYSGIFHLLPLGLRVQSKLEALIDKHMSSLRASKVSLSYLSSQQLWDKTGRLSGGSEFFKFKDRKDMQWLLAPTHEEEITALVKSIVFAPGQLPLRLYQTGRKYRDEKRPRGGLLRGREFVMKDLYNFDKDEASAIATYEEVRKAYANFFDELKVPYIEASADSGNMGGNLSHEFHIPSWLGEDILITCSNCDVARNEEYVPPFSTIDITSSIPHNNATTQKPRFITDVYLSKDHETLVRVFARGDSPGTLNSYAIKSALSAHNIDLDTGLESPQQIFDSLLKPSHTKPNQRLIYLFDNTFTHSLITHVFAHHQKEFSRTPLRPTILQIDDPTHTDSHLISHRPGHPCPSCGQGTLKTQRAIEVGHTFHLGDRYSSKLDLRVPGTSSLVQMGCHGIGVSRLIAATASVLSDHKGLFWPRAIAPFEVVICADRRNETYVKAAEDAYDELSKEGVDCLIDDREGLGMGWKFRDADLIGYCVVVIVGRTLGEGCVEVQARRLGLKEVVRVEDLSKRVGEILAQL